MKYDPKFFHDFWSQFSTMKKKHQYSKLKNEPRVNFQPGRVSMCSVGDMHCMAYAILSECLLFIFFLPFFKTNYCFLLVLPKHFINKWSLCDWKLTIVLLFIFNTWSLFIWINILIIQLYVITQLTHGNLNISELHYTSTSKLMNFWTVENPRKQYGLSILFRKSWFDTHVMHAPNRIFR